MKPRYQLIPILAALAFAGGCADTFPRADRDKDGLLSEDEVAKELLSAIFESGDTDEDGRITYAESRTLDPNYSEARFKQRDLNGDGGVTPEELLQFAEREGTLDKLFDMMDSNDDGYVDKLEAKAFAELLEQQEGDTQLQQLSNLTEQ